MKADVNIITKTVSCKLPSHSAMDVIGKLATMFQDDALFLPIKVGHWAQMLKKRR